MSTEKKKASKAEKEYQHIREQAEKLHDEHIKKVCEMIHAAYRLGLADADKKENRNGFDSALSAVRNMVETRILAEIKGKKRHDKRLKKLRASHMHKDGAKKTTHERAIKTRAKILVLLDVMKMLPKDEPFEKLIEPYMKEMIEKVKK